MLMYVSGDDIGLVRREPFTGAQDSYQEGAAAVTLVESQAAPPSNIIGDCYAPAHWDGARAQSNDSSSEWLSWDQRVSRLLLPGAKRYSCSSYCAPMTSISKLCKLEQCSDHHWLPVVDEDGIYPVAYHIRLYIP